MFKAMAMIGSMAFLIGICCGSIGWSAILVVCGGTLAAIGANNWEEDKDEYYC